MNVFLMDGEKSCVKEILGELWQRIDVTFYRKYVKIVDQQDVNLQYGSANRKSAECRSGNGSCKTGFSGALRGGCGKYAGTDFIYTAPRYGK